VNYYVTSGYRKREYILKNINLKIDHNTIILGPNGSGKTTLFRTILGLTPHKKGEILIDGVNIESMHGNPGLIATNLPEIFMHTRLSIRELADLYLYSRRRFRLFQGDSLQDGCKGHTR